MTAQHPHGVRPPRGHPRGPPGGHPGGHPGAQPHAGASRRNLDFDSAPFIAIWETTQACDLACQHCRAMAQPLRNSGELSTDEAKALMKRLREFGPIVFVFSGGDCFKRPDIVELVGYGAELGMRMGITPATTALATKELLQQLKDVGLTRLAISLDGSNATIHDEFRRVQGSFDHGLRILREAQEVGLSTQVNTVIRKANIDDMDAMTELMTTLGVVFWEVFFLVPMGRAKADDVASAEEFESVFHQLYDLSRTAPFDIKATAAPQYSRVVMARKRAEVRAGADEDVRDVMTRGMHYSQSDGIGRARNVNDGDGFVFISHTGDVYPSGFLPIRAGNIREDDIIDIYRNAPVFRELRDRTLLKGKCGVCGYRDACGGSRARAYAMTGDHLAEEPFCAYEVRDWAGSPRSR
ncbi:MAG: TIGR04053 family radical SAM/SPASM domain-containing protein [Propionibacteriaceae bacterium]|nr:TIGR04053 family radical SAM/SPASM domain-containing protein [Propionibacteriaceae bacterium]